MIKNFLFLFICLTSTGYCTVFEWTGGGDGINWEDDTNWKDGVAPGGYINHDVIINDATDIQVNSTFPIGRLRIKNSQLTINTGFKITVFMQSVAPADTLLAMQMINSDLELYGQLFIESTDRNFALSLRNSTLTAYTGSTINIYESVYGITVLNNALLDLKTGSVTDIKSDSLGIRNNEDIMNNGKMTLEVDINGVLNNGLFTTTDTLIIDGYGVSILTAFENSGTLNNEGYMSIEDTNLYGIKNTGTVTNAVGAYLKIYDITLSSLVGSSAVYSEGSFVNNGEIYSLVRTQFGFFNYQNPIGFLNNGKAYFTGGDSLSFVNVGSLTDSSLLNNSGILNLDVGGDVFLNNEFGKVLWTGTGHFGGADCLINQGRFEINNDSLEIDANGTAILNSGYMHNNGYVKIVQCKNGLSNSGEFNNKPMSQLVLNAAIGSPTSFALENLQTFTNEGYIEIFNNIFGIKNNHIFDNIGVINMRYSTDAFLSNFGSAVDSSYFSNSGSISIKANNSPASGNTLGIWNYNKGSFKSEGVISMSELWQNAQNIKNESFLYFTDSINIKESREVNVFNSGTMLSGSGGFLNIDCAENFGQHVIHNQGDIVFNGRTTLDYEDPFQRNIALINNEGTYLNDGCLRINGNNQTEGILNSGTFTNADSILLKEMRANTVVNSNSFVNQSNAFFQVDSSFGTSIIYSGPSFQNMGEMDLNGETKIEVLANDVFQNNGKLELKNGIGNSIRLAGTNPTFTNLTGGEILIDSSDTESILDYSAIKIEVGQFVNSGKINLNHISDAGIHLTGGSFTNNDSLWLFGPKGMQGIMVDNATFTNNGYLNLNSGGEDNVSLMYVQGNATLTNSGEIVLTDAFNRGVYILGIFNALAGSNFHFENNTRNTGSLLYHSNFSSPVVYNGDMSSMNSIGCVTFHNTAINNGYLDLKGCGNHAMAMASGTNSSTGHILLDFGSFVGTNNGIIEYFSDSSYTLTGTNTMTNTGIIIDHGNQFRNVKFNDGDALGHPIWNKGLFVSPFHGTLSNGINENINLNFTETGTLPISNDWYTDRAMTTVAGSWHQTDHYFTPNAVANAADSIFFQVDLSATNAKVLSIPHKILGTCPQPEITRILRTSLDRNWNKHSSWRGNRMPQYCDKVLLTGHEYLYVPADFKAAVNHFEFVPQIGPSRYFEVQTGAVMEMNIFSL